MFYGNGVMLARVHAGACSQTAPGALFATACKKLHTSAIAVSDVIVFVFRVLTAVAANDDFRRFAGVSESQNFRDFFFLFF